MSVAAQGRTNEAKWPHPDVSSRRPPAESFPWENQSLHSMENFCLQFHSQPRQEPKWSPQSNPHPGRFEIR